ncbi:hypothetical protein LTI14_03145 [Nesterenkonia sp. YGD6]|uniref:hypothetical protein n=1 Tax=Nesterenkonia sp. YGD6 TaxID=2901231 RepID=UPI001F4C6F1F|nr:hypothetical protein [Nesterenkonia sp. YGD6]MCH8562220.1 hypothetical protein [Nesterenkonia sp. YGD6]
MEPVCPVLTLPSGGRSSAGATGFPAAPEGALLAPESDLPVGMITIVLYGGNCLAALLAHQAWRD